MRRILRALPLIAVTGLAATSAVAAPILPCAADAERQALKLLRFHSDGDARATVDPASVRSVGTVASLVGTRRFQVIEVEGSIYKGAYRIRLIYAPMPGSCVLMGQEILERSDPY